jgi:hypothetical protein
VNFAAITFYVASQQVFFVVVVDFVMTRPETFGYTLVQGLAFVDVVAYVVKGIGGVG